MGEWNPLKIDDFTWDVLKVYIKHGYGDYKLYNTTFFSCQLSDETVCMTLQEFYDEKAFYIAVRFDCGGVGFIKMLQRFCRILLTKDGIQ